MTPLPIVPSHTFPLWSSRIDRIYEELSPCSISINFIFSMASSLYRGEEAFTLFGLPGKNLPGLFIESVMAGSAMTGLLGIITRGIPALTFIGFMTLTGKIGVHYLLLDQEISRSS